MVSLCVGVGIVVDLVVVSEFDEMWVKVCGLLWVFGVVG